MHKGDGVPAAQSTQMGIGARVLRKEDARHLHGRGLFVADIAMPGMLDAAFVRSPCAHGLIRSIRYPRNGLAFTADDLRDLRPILPPNNIPGSNLAPFPVLAAGKVRFVGEPMAVVLADTRAQAEDLAELVDVDLEELAPVVSVEQAMAENAVWLHEQWRTNVVHELELNAGGEESFQRLDAAPVKVVREYRMARQSMNPMEGKGCLAYWDRRLDQLVLYSSTQVPHLIRDGVCEAIGLRRSQLRVVAPDVGGGFGYKSILQAEEVVVAWLAMRLRRPVRWLEDRREHLIAAANAREQIYRVTAYANRDGTLLGLDADISVDAGAYSAYPFTNMLDAGMAIGNMTGPYRIPCYRGRSRAVATNKPPVAPYRGVARPGACFAIEQLIDAVAKAVGQEPWEVRRRNLIRPDEMPYTTVTKKTYDSGNYPEALRRTLDMMDVRAIRSRQAQGADGDGRLGVGVAFFVELTGHSPGAAKAWGLPVRPGPEPATVRLTADGTLEVRIGLQSHGQGMETTMAQVACEILGIDISNISVLHGDTATSAFSTGTYGSRGMVVGGGAVAGACRLLARKLEVLGAARLGCQVDQVALETDRVSGPGGSIEIRELARLWHEDAGAFGPAAAQCASLEATFGYDMQSGQGAYTYGAHAALVKVDTQTGGVQVLDYVVVEDCGTIVNPLIVDGQIIGGTVQGIGSALYEETIYDSAGQPRCSTLIDYLLPGAGDVPFVRIGHMMHRSPYTEFGIKGVGEGGAIPSAPAVCSAVNDALREYSVELCETPLSPERVLRALMSAEPSRARPAEVVA